MSTICSLEKSAIVRSQLCTRASAQKRATSGSRYFCTRHARSLQLHLGELILAENFSDPNLLSLAKEILRNRNAQSVKLFTSASIINSMSERNEIARKSDAAAVDMETGAIVGLCNAHQMPLLSVRGISDTPRDPLPAPPDVLFDIERQKTNYGRLFAYILREPASALRLWRFGQTIARVRATLTEALVELIGGL